QRLFTEIVSGDIGPIQEPRAQMLAESMPYTDNLEQDLCEFARSHLAQVMQPHLLRMRRVLIGEGERFPDLARTWYENGPERSYAMFAGWFEALDRRGLLVAPDPLLAAKHFNWLVLSVPVNKAMAYPIDEASITDDELAYYADAAVRVFLAAYGAAGRR
ncbi:MAG: TetR/AcrR family transcriptional regulator C-terminal domain-containing protein, partial [Thermocrispum sp.]